MREYSVHLKEYSDNLKTVYKVDTPAANAAANASVAKMGSPEESKVVYLENKFAALADSLGIDVISLHCCSFECYIIFKFHRY